MMDRFKAQTITFVSEKCGSVEEKLGRQIASSLMTYSEVVRAYLMRVQYEQGSGEEVALCLEGGQIHAREIVIAVGEIFAEVFNRTESLDILFLTEPQVVQVRAAARPFYEAVNTNFAN